MADLNRLSCVKCKERKVRCSRVMPRCDRCKTQGIECVYPVRQKRKANRPLAERPVQGTQDDALTAILDRLQRVEKQTLVQATASAPSPAYSPYQDPSSSSTYPSYGPSATSSPAYLSSLEGHSTPHDVGGSASDMVPDTIGILESAMSGVLRLRLQTLRASVVTDEIKIPPDLAKSWIRNYFAKKPTDMFLNLIDRKFFEMMPDMMSFPHVHVDSCILVIYYSILCGGSSIIPETEQVDKSREWPKLTYLGCLRALPGWQAEATGSITDLIASVSLTRVAGASFDYEVAWKTFKLACEYAQGLGLHNLDGGHDVMRGIHNPDISDDDRKAFWDLIQVDAFFRLILDKPPSISGNAWKVNLPWLDPSQPPPRPDTTMMMFLLNSRVTLILIQFFAMLEERPQNTTDMIRRTKEMCQEILTLYDEWSPTQWVGSTDISGLDSWVVADITLRGYTCIIFMFRKIAPAERPVPPMVINVALRLLGIVGWLLSQYHFAPALASLFGPYRVHVPFSYAIEHLLRCTDMSAYAEDVEALDRVVKCVSDITRAERDFAPLARTLESLNAQVRKRARWR